MTEIKPNMNLTDHMRKLWSMFGMGTLLLELEAICVYEGDEGVRLERVGEHLRAAMAVLDNEQREGSK